MKKSQPGETRNSSVEGNLKRLSTGSVLLARESLQDPNFDASVILICLHGKEGAYGLVLNRPCHMPLSEIFDGFRDSNLNREIYIGGPVQQNEMQIVQVTETPMEGAYEIVPGTYLGGKWDSLTTIIESDSSNTRLFLGYSGWSPGQLEDEIKVGAWDVYQTDVKKLILQPEKLLRSEVSEIADYLKCLQG